MSRSVAVVTGAGRGIGLAIAHRLASRGHRVLLTDIDEQAAAQAANDVGSGAWSLAQDVRDAASHAAIAKAAMDVGDLRIWVNNAGILEAGDAWSHSEAQVSRLLDINVHGTVHGSNAAVRAMGHNGGAILNVASISAISPVPGLALYAASKAAVVSYSTSLQGDLDHAGLPIRVRALCPDVVATQMVADVAHDPGAAMLFSGPAPLSPDDVARAGLELLDSRQIVRVVPRWRGVIARSAGIAPSIGLPVTALMRRTGDRRQNRPTPHIGG